MMYIYTIYSQTSLTQRAALVHHNLYTITFHTKKKKESRGTITALPWIVDSYNTMTFMNRNIGEQISQVM